MNQPPREGADPGLDAVMGERRQLLNLGYRMLGSLADAEDVVQETYARWYAMAEEERAAVRSPGAWMTTVASRICLDLLGSARARRERYVGEWVPEPLPDRAEWVGGGPGAAPPDPADRVTLDESVSMAFLVVLDSLTPAQRVVFVLHDVFRYSFVEVAEIVGRTPEACRQLAASARRRLDRAGSPPAPTAEQAEVVRRFRRAWAAKDVGALMEVLAPDATGISDGGGRVTATPSPMVGGARIAEAFVGIAERVPDLTLLERSVNGRPGLVARRGEVTEAVIAFEVLDGRITQVWAVRNPDKLRPWKENE